MLNLVKGQLRYAYVELTNACNFNCIFCPNAIMTRKRSSMPVGLAKKIIDELAYTKIAKHVFFHLMGEPLLHKDWYEIFEYAIKKGLDVNFNTNCSMLDDETSEKLFSLPIRYIGLSLQTPTPQTFRLHNVKDVSFDDIIYRIKKIIKKKFEKMHHVELELFLLNTSSFIKNMMDLKSDIEALGNKELAKDVLSGWITFSKEVINEYSIKFITPSQDAVESINLIRGFSLEILPNVFITSRRPTSWANTITNRSRIMPGVIGGCDALREQFGILSNGDMVLCCLDFDGKTAIGNVNEMTIVDILKTRAAEKIKRNFRFGILTHPHCKLCRGGSSIKIFLTRQLGTLITHSCLRPRY